MAIYKFSSRQKDQHRSKKYYALLVGSVTFDLDINAALELLHTRRGHCSVYLMEDKISATAAKLDLRIGYVLP